MDGGGQRLAGPYFTVGCVRRAAVDALGATGLCLGKTRFHRRMTEQTENPPSRAGSDGADAMRAAAADGHRESQGPVLDLPEKSPIERHIVVLVFLLSFFYLYLFRRYTAMDPDEGIILQGAERILHGEVLYRDFFSYFTPGSYYLIAVLFKLFGSSIIVARNALVFLGSILSVLTYLLARRAVSRWVALVTGALSTLTCLPYRFLVLHNWDSTLWACLAVYCAVRFLETFFAPN